MRQEGDLPAGHCSKAGPQGVAGLKCRGAVAHRSTHAGQVRGPSALGFIHVDEPLTSVGCPEVLFCPASVVGVVMPNWLVRSWTYVFRSVPV